MSESPTARTVADCLRLFVRPGAVTEIRALDVPQNYGRPCTVSGYFDHEHLTDAAQEALRLSNKGRARGVYFVPNAIDKNLLARRMNQVDRAGDGETTSDKSIVRRHWLYIDADPLRDSKISSNDEEKAIALALVREVREFLRGRGWPDPVLADSGDGGHLLYAIDLPADDGGLVQRVLLALSQRFDNERVIIDRKLFNAARIMKLYGTVARKGDNAPDLGRVHRRAVLLEVPGCADPSDASGADIKQVPVELLQSLAAEVKEEEPPTPPPGPTPSTNGHGYKSRLLMDKWLTARGVSYRVKPQPDGTGRIVYVLKECPFDATHGDPDSCVMQDANGKNYGFCFHNSCAGRGWKDFRDAIGKPDGEHYDPPLGRRRGSGWPKRNKQPAGGQKTGEESPAADQEVIEAKDDPHRLARIFLADYTAGDILTLQYWREEWYQHDGFAWRLLPLPELRAALATRIKNQFNDDWRRAHDAWERSGGVGANGKEIPEPVVRKVTTKLLGDVLNAALVGLTVLSGSVVAPAWLTDDAPFPACETLVCRNAMVHLPTWAGGRQATHALTPALFTTNALDYDFDANARTRTASVSTATASCSCKSATSCLSANGSVGPSSCSGTARRCRSPTTLAAANGFREKPQRSRQASSSGRCDLRAEDRDTNSTRCFGPASAKRPSGALTTEGIDNPRVLFGTSAAAGAPFLHFFGMPSFARGRACAYHGAHARGIPNSERHRPGCAAGGRPAVAAGLHPTAPPRRPEAGRREAGADPRRHRPGP
jgi:hypothetical protein